MRLRLQTAVEIIASTTNTEAAAAAPVRDLRKKVHRLRRSAGGVKNTKVANIQTWPVLAARRSDSFQSGICHRIRVGRTYGWTETLLEQAEYLKNGKR